MLSAETCIVVTLGFSASIRLYVPCQVALVSPRHVVSDMSLFFLLLGSIIGCPVAGEAEAIVVFLDFFPILLKSVSAEEFCTETVMGVIQEIIA